MSIGCDMTAFNRFYHENRIISEQDPIKRNSWLKLIMLVKDILSACLDLLGIEVPEKM
jgi:arginyl-tRNA synthetase